MPDEYLTPTEFEDLVYSTINDLAPYDEVEKASEDIEKLINTYRKLYDEFIGGEEDEVPV